MGVEFIAFNLIIDDIVFPDGRTRMGKLGGGGPQAAFGMRLFSDQVGLVAGVGEDIPVAADEWFKEAGIDTNGVRHTAWPTPRAWQVMETDGKRTQVFRIPGEAVSAQLTYAVDRFPAEYKGARGFHFGIHPDEPPLGFARELHDLGTTISIEPFKEAADQLQSDQLRQLLASVDIYSPNLREATSELGSGKPDQLLKRYGGFGAQIVVLRMGEQGSLVHYAKTGEIIHIPAVPVEVVDSIGAGNAYCGAFLVGWVQTGDLETAGRYGAVAASFLVEQVGLPDFERISQAEVHRRLRWVHDNSEAL